MQRVAIITGASRGLGLSLTKKFLEKGYRVFGISKTDHYWKRALENLPHQKNVSFHRADLTQESQVKELVSLIMERVPSVDVLVNNAGIGGRLLRMEEVSSEELHAALLQNLFSAFLMSKHLIPLFRKQERGFIIHISSMAGQRAVPRLFPYSASKFGLQALSQCIAKENADSSLKSIAVCPGGMNTQMRADLFGKEDAQKQQGTDFVADIVFRVTDGDVHVESGGDIVIRHGEITAVHPCPGL